jgi:hypothetical protein
MASTLASVLEGREEVTCPICTRPLVISPLPDGKRRFDACGRNCLPVYYVPDDSIAFGPADGVMFIYHRRWRPDVPKPTCRPRYTNGGW